MSTLRDPYIIRYPRITAVASDDGRRVELIEFFDCVGGAMWSRCHYADSPIVERVRCVGGTMRYLLRAGSSDLALEGSRFPAGISACVVDDSEIAISYIGMGGGGVGAAACRTDARGILRSRSDESGGGRIAGSTIWLPRMQRLLIGVDDTDTPLEGATWTLVHNISKAVEDEHSIYLSHTIVQLFPVPFRTKNCVGLVAEFATSDHDRLVARFRQLLERYTLSEKTGMAIYSGFAPSEELEEFGWMVKKGEIDPAISRTLRDPALRIILAGRGVTGAIAALPFSTRYAEALELCNGMT